MAFVFFTTISFCFFFYFKKLCREYIYVGVCKCLTRNELTGGRRVFIYYSFIICLLCNQSKRFRQLRAPGNDVWLLDLIGSHNR